MLAAACQFFALNLPARTETLSPLTGRGYAVLPVPQKVALGPKDFAFTDGWQLLSSPGVKADDVAIESLNDQLAERFRITLADPKAPRGQGGIIRLAIAPGSVAVGKAADKNKSGLADQAYHLSLKPQEIRVSANAALGLFYGVQTLVQLLRPQGNRWSLPEG